MESFSKAKQFKLMTAENNKAMADAYLRKVSGKYTVLLLGKNGEP